ncbi:hypothetical protein A3D80_02720 [Candidatus Roizmanbacteria bacterium RIFCSPHIGHO2_02_FULL_40_13b]|nr:MAG: hypothetical protein A3D80_02720 [Candidatus Roizmanbacteria bacterium RIFCSPHIGHO2_02_FULL_40_13b]
MFDLIKKYRYMLLLLVIVGFVGIANYQPGTFLTGWDNVQTELYPSLAVKRAFFAVWQEYQSLGLVGGMAHGADLLRALGVWIMSFFLPQSLIRYVFHLGMWFVGGMGAYQLIKMCHSEKVFPFLGALFYMLNFATIQLFYLPFEPFSIFFASLPWMIWAFLHTITPPISSSSPQLLRPTLSPYLLLFLVNILATPSFYIQTLFVVYMIILGVIALFNLPISSSSPHLLRPTRSPHLLLLSSLAIIIAANLFWLLPQAYFLKTNNTVVSNAKINQIATVDVQYQNKARADISSVATFKGFYVDLVGKNGTPLFSVWQQFNNLTIYQLSAFALFAIVLLGITKKSRFRNPFLTIWSICALALLFPAEGSGFFAQIFRSPFTKFAIPFALFSSYFFAEGISRAHNVILEHTSVIPDPDRGSIQIDSRLRGNDKIRLLVVIVAALILILATSFPVFTGNFFSNDMKVSIPKQYFSLFDYFKNKPEHDRIALLPDATFWGWFNYRWGYTGSGFLWYGIKQPIISRTFDVWSDKSESYFWQMKTALEAENMFDVNDVLKKYNVRYLVLDESMLPVSSTDKSLQIDRIKQILEKDEFLFLDAQFENISVYKVSITSSSPPLHSSATPNLPIFSSPPLPNIGPIIPINNKDIAYSSLSTYKTDPSVQFDRFYPFASLMSETKLSSQVWSLQEESANFVVKTELPINIDDYDLFFDNKTGLTNDIYLSNTQLVIPITKVPVVKAELESTEITDCSPIHSISGSGEAVFEDNSLNLSSKGPVTHCFAYDFPDISQKDGFVIKVNFKNEVGKGLFFYIQDDTKKQAVIEDRLPSGTSYYFIPPHYNFGFGYTVGFQQDAGRTQTAKNALSNLEIYTFPVKELKEMYFQKKGYVVGQMKEDSSTTVISDQAYDDGWILVTKDRSPAKHILVNNWQNGWELSNEKSDFYIIFWPQVLEFAGFLAIIVILIPLCGRRI